MIIVDPDRNPLLWVAYPKGFGCTGKVKAGRESFMSGKIPSREMTKEFEKNAARTRKWMKFKAQLPYYVLFLIPLAFFLIFKYWPMFGLAMSFQDYKAGAPFMGPRTKWVGLKWFEKLFSSPNLGRWVSNTLLLSVYSLVIQFPLSIALAVLLNEINNKTIKKFTSNVSLLPHFISTVVIVGIMFQLFSVDDGVINFFIEKLGGSKIDFMGRSEWFRTMYVGSGVWQSTGFEAVVFTAAIAGIDPALYEAAAMDGSTRFKNILYITIPCILPTIITMFLLKIGGLMSSGYEKIILMYSPQTYETADTLATYSYRAGILDGKLSLSTTIGLFNSVCNLLLLTVSNWLSRKFTDTSLY